jgi:signal transduction histidine kinase
MGTASRDERILVFAPLGRDAAHIAHSLDQAQVLAQVCPDFPHLLAELKTQVGGVILTEQALASPAVDDLLETLDTQPPWSDLPLIVILGGGPTTPTRAHLAAMLGRRANATLLQRPIRAELLVGAVQVALRARRRQYRFRDCMIRLAAAEEAERRARSDAEAAHRARDEFVGAVSHDLKNPLAAIKAFAQLLQRQVARSAPLEPTTLLTGLGRIDAMVIHTVAQLDELVDVTRLQANQPLRLELRETDLVALARRVAADYQQTTTFHQLHVETDLPALEGYWDAPRLERVLGTLLANAIRGSREGGGIVIGVQRKADPAPLAILSVSDHGVGISRGDLPQIFERHNPGTHAAGRLPGTEMGLAGVWQIVEQHGGTISVVSKPGKGTTFTVHLPVGRQPPAALTVTSDSERAAD